MTWLKQLRETVETGGVTDDGYVRIYPGTALAMLDVIEACEMYFVEGPTYPLLEKYYAATDALELLCERMEGE